jgi:hypothetical protein
VQGVSREDRNIRRLDTAIQTFSISGHVSIELGVRASNQTARYSDGDFAVCRFGTISRRQSWFRPSNLHRRREDRRRPTILENVRGGWALPANRIRHSRLYNPGSKRGHDPVRRSWGAELPDIAAYSIGRHRGGVAGALRPTLHVSSGPEPQRGETIKAQVGAQRRPGISRRVVRCGSPNGARQISARRTSPVRSCRATIVSALQAFVRFYRPQTPGLRKTSAPGYRCLGPSGL